MTTANTADNQPETADGLNQSSTAITAGMEDALSVSAHKAVARIREILEASRNRALIAVNVAMVQAYWQTGREIVEEELRGRDRADYGAQFMELLARQLTAEFGRGFDRTNLTNIRNFYLAFPILDALRQELSWTHYRLLSRVRAEEPRRFYVAECVRSRWSTRELERQINSFLYERVAASRDKESVLKLAEQGAQAFVPADIVRDPYVLEFTGLPESGAWLESDLEEALVDRLQQFLLEAGRDLFFVARQKRITIDGDHFYIDLVFYHRSLRCFVLINLKTGKLTQQDLGQMLLYTGYYEAEEMQAGENPPVGLILCADKNEAVVRYTLGPNAQRIFAARYQMHLPTEEQLQRELSWRRDQFLSQHGEVAASDSLPERSVLYAEPDEAAKESADASDARGSVS